MIELALLFIKELVLHNRAVVRNANQDRITSDVLGPRLT